MEKLSTEARRAYNNYMRAWRHNHADKVRNYAVQYWERRVQKEVQQECKVQQTVDKLF